MKRKREEREGRKDPPFLLSSFRSSFKLNFRSCTSRRRREEDMVLFASVLLLDKNWTTQAAVVALVISMHAPLVVFLRR